MLAARHTAAVCLILSLLLLSVPHASRLCAQSQELPHPPEIDPNAIQDSSVPMTIEINGIPEGESVNFRIVTAEACPT
jgi:hypothetical protein